MMMMSYAAVAMETKVEEKLTIRGRAIDYAVGGHGIASQ
jgi:hypothetical protein